MAVRTRISMDINPLQEKEIEALTETILLSAPRDETGKAKLKKRDLYLPALVMGLKMMIMDKDEDMLPALQNMMKSTLAPMLKSTVEFLLDNNVILAYMKQLVEDQHWKVFGDLEAKDFRALQKSKPEVYADELNRITAEKLKNE